MNIKTSICSLDCFITRWLIRVNHYFSKPGTRSLTISFIIASIVFTVAGYAMTPWYEILINKSNSLPGLVYVLDKTMTPQCGDHTMFEMPRSERFYRGSRLIKIIRGCEGDTVSVTHRQIFINNWSAGLAMETTSDGKYQLPVITEAVIPQGKVYLYASHPRSYDSRYADFGLRDADELLGTAHRVF